MNTYKKMMRLATGVAMVGLLATPVLAKDPNHHDDNMFNNMPKAKNIIFFVGDGMGVSTVTASRIYSVGVDGELTMDTFPHTALSKTYTADHITPDSAGTMTAMMTGVNANSGIIGYGPETERNDFNHDGDGDRLWTLLEIAKQKGKKVGVVTTARVTHATPAACYAHVSERNHENDIALQALPTDVTYNERLGDGIDLLMGGGRRFFTPGGMTDEEGDTGSRTDGRDLRREFQDAGYTYIWNQEGFDNLEEENLPILGLFERSHMEYEYDRPNDLGGEPTLEAMVEKSIDLLENKKGYFLMVEGGRIDHAHHAGNAFRALTDTEEFDRAIATAVKKANLRNTLIIVTADHSHVFTIAGYPMRQPSDLKYDFGSAPQEYLDNDMEQQHGGILDVVYDISSSTGDITARTAKDGAPYAMLGYQNGSGYRPEPRLAPQDDPFPGLGGAETLIPDEFGNTGSEHTQYKQEAAVPLGSETHAAEDVAIYAIGPQAWMFHGTVKNTHIFDVMQSAFKY